MTKNSDPFIYTYTGQHVHFYEPDPESILIEDIAHALSLQCRFNGQCPVFYSVAQHSIHLSQIVPAEHALWALLHDASEAYITDMPSPYKQEMPTLIDADTRFLTVITGKYGLKMPMPRVIHDMDVSMAAAEAIYLWEFVGMKPRWAIDAQPMTKYSFNNFELLEPEEAENAFLERFHALTATSGS